MAAQLIDNLPKKQNALEQLIMQLDTASLPLVPSLDWRLRATKGQAYD